MNVPTAVLRKPSPEQQEMLDQHALWLKSGGKQGKRINNKDFTVDLSGLDLDGVNLSQGLLEVANFGGSSLKHAIFTKATLTSARFCDCDLRFANFEHANLVMAMFRGTQTEGANFNGADTTLTLWTPAHERGAKLAFRRSLAGVSPLADISPEKQAGRPAARHRHRIQGIQGR